MSPSGKTTDIFGPPTSPPIRPSTTSVASSTRTSPASTTPTPMGFKADGTAYFVEYKEGIYYGYRYYETAAVEAAAGDYPGFDYDSAVVFPFGYGLSYTTFAETLDSVEVSGDDVKVSVTVTNSGSVAGKQVVGGLLCRPVRQGRHGQERRRAWRFRQDERAGGGSLRGRRGHLPRAQHGLVGLGQERLRARLGRL